MSITHKISGQSLRHFLRSPLVVQAMPALALFAYWGFGEPGLVSVAIAGPLAYMLAGRRSPNAVDPVTALPDITVIERGLSDILSNGERGGRSTALINIAIDDYPILSGRLGQKTSEAILRHVAGRLETALRDHDLIAHRGSGRFLVVLSPALRCDLEALIQICSRLQSSVEEPIILDGNLHYLTACAGFCLEAHVPTTNPTSMIAAADQALDEALQNGPGAIRAFRSGATIQASATPVVQADLEAAFDNGHIIAWFQPQVSTDTGRVTGMEALARWAHPGKGTLGPAEFLAAIEQCGMSVRLSEVMLSQAMRSLRRFDKAGLDIPVIAVNFSANELQNPKLADKIRWELDRHDLAPNRLCVEILESVVAGRDDDVIARNIRAISDMGCRIDLDDFGTGHASISSIRRFAVDRIKIDRSFVTRVDQDQNQREMISAILTMAEQLHLDTLAEGVETVAEHAILAQLGCGHVQGFGLARPMPADDVAAWIERHNAKLAAAPQIGRRTG